MGPSQWRSFSRSTSTGTPSLQRSNRALRYRLQPIMGSDDGKVEDTSKPRTKGMRRVKRNASSWWQSYIPTEIVCHASPSSIAPGSVVVEWGLLLSLSTLLFWLAAFGVMFTALPSDETPWSFRQGAPLNLANPSSAQKQRTVGAAQKAPAADKESSVYVPPSKWPVSLRDEPKDTYDTILHPGDGTSVMKVPRFWSPPVHQQQLMSRALAMKIGSCTDAPDPNNHSIGDACPLEKRTIYVGIASYRDFECRSTVESIFLRAQHPERIRVGVVDQIVDGEDAICNAPIKPCTEDPEQALCKYADQVDVYQMEAELSIGPVFARHIGYRLYRGEYYATQSDAHVTYTMNWDMDIIAQLEETKNEMAVLSTYLTDVQGSISPEGDSLRDTRPIMCNTIYEGGAQGMHLRHASQPEREPFIHGSPQLQPWWAAGYSFSRGHFVVNVPYDWLQPMIFQGEEMSIGIRGFTIGYDYYAPERSVCFHHYSVGENAKKRSKVHHFWENDTKYAGTGRKAMMRLLGMVHMNPEDPAESWDHSEEDVYGIGGVRTPEKFYETFGINVVDKTIEGHLCRFVDIQGRMHKAFMPHLRPDGMGIDYGEIHFKFKDPAPDEK
jgi:[Skp1-protein]-hydroxyproline N-acetylglucosaminyltransferase